MGISAETIARSRHREIFVKKSKIKQKDETF